MLFDGREINRKENKLKRLNLRALNMRKGFMILLPRSAQVLDKEPKIKWRVKFGWDDGGRRGRGWGCGAGGEVFWWGIGFRFS